MGWFSYCLERVRFDNKCVLPKYFPFLRPNKKLLVGCWEDGGALEVETTCHYHLPLSFVISFHLLSLAVLRC